MSTSIANPVTAVALGNFDGMHLGHRALFERLGKEGGVVVVEHYRANLTPGVYRASHTTFPLFFYDFDKIRDLEPDAFVARLKESFPRLKKIVVGEDFRFGVGAKGDVSTLEALFSGEVEVVSEVKLGEEGVHSRHIRQAVERGDMALASAMLGRPYEILGEVIRGQGIGGKALVPTLNLFPGRFLLPAAGVYRTETTIGGGRYASVTFVGHRHTTDGKFAVETHLIGETLHGERILEASVRFLEKLRDNRKFDTLEALKAQIEKDIEDARKR